MSSISGFQTKVVHTLGPCFSNWFGHKLFKPAFPTLISLSLTHPSNPSPSLDSLVTQQRAPGICVQCMQFYQKSVWQPQRLPFLVFSLWGLCLVTLIKLLEKPFLSHSCWFLAEWKNGEWAFKGLKKKWWDTDSPVMKSCLQSPGDGICIKQLMAGKPPD